MQESHRDTENPRVPEPLSSSFLSLSLTQYMQSLLTITQHTNLSPSTPFVASPTCDSYSLWDLHLGAQIGFVVAIIDMVEIA